MDDIPLGVFPTELASNAGENAYWEHASPAMVQGKKKGWNKLALTR